MQLHLTQSELHFNPLNNRIMLPEIWKEAIDKMAQDGATELMRWELRSQLYGLEAFDDAEHKKLYTETSNYVRTKLREIDVQGI